ncbi:hypothetical protein B296_00053623 [Ensete ventricosum]|uniref:Uncharacterized protein n=1 Tax=Ensete ventricosum TaxID=4639 RepID=A0A426XB20_ENSVE|nr:hypothetical protein B296_00053623 [Ensete ventricosum]
MGATTAGDASVGTAPLWAGHGRCPYGLAVGNVAPCGLTAGGRCPCSLAVSEHHPLRAGHGQAPLLATLVTYDHICRCLAIADRPYKCMAVVDRPLSLLPSLRKLSKNA